MTILRVVALAALTCGLLSTPTQGVHAQDGVEDVARRAAGAKLRPGDRIQLRFLRAPELNASFNVNERGEAMLPKIGATAVAAYTIGELPDTLRRKYAEYFRDPEIDVSVFRRVVVNGEVKAPSIYYLDIASSVRDAIAAAGGVLETGNRKNVTIVRGDRRISAAHWDRSQGAEYDLMSGDQVIVGRKPWLVLNALPVISTSVIVIGLIQSLRNN